MTIRTAGIESALIRPSVEPFVFRGPGVHEILNEINGVIDSDYKGNKALKEYNGEPVLQIGQVNEAYITPVMVGSNSLILPVINKVVAPHFRVMFPEEVERSLREGDPMGIEEKFAKIRKFKII